MTCLPVHVGEPAEHVARFDCRDVTSAIDRLRMREHVTHVINTASVSDTDMQIFIRTGVIQ